MGDIDCDAIPADQAVCRTCAALRGNHWLPMTAAPVDADDCAPGLETEPTPPKPAAARGRWRC